MKLCVKYCGGCNPRFDRKEIIRRLTKEYNKIVVCNYKDGEDCDLVVILAGCRASCVDHGHIDGRFGKVIINELEDYEKIKGAIEINNS